MKKLIGAAIAVMFSLGSIAVYAAADTSAQPGTKDEAKAAGAIPKTQVDKNADAARKQEAADKKAAKRKAKADKRAARAKAKADKKAAREKAEADAKAAKANASAPAEAKGSMKK